MNRFPILLMLACLVLATMSATAQVRNVTDPDAPRSLPETGAVAVDWTDPAEFSDIKHSGNRWEASRGNWVEQLARHLQQSAHRQLPEGQRLKVTITDIERAGHYEPRFGAGQDIRVLRDIYPPSISLNFQRYDSNGNLVAEGERRLRDMNYLNRSPSRLRNDNLYYEKRLIDDWARREFSELATTDS